MGSPPPTDPRTLIGWREWIHLPDLLDGGWIKAKVDTGARTSALHAWDVERIDRDGSTWVRFSLHPRQHDDDHVVQAEALLLEEREVRSSNGEVEVRPVVETTLALGGERYAIELTLTKRDQMGFRMLLGRTGMARHLLVDPGSSYLLGGDRHRPPG
ncbi:MAG TPA: ATP-dependent zinc protease [Acidimicrobiaceae bacterium]|nr:ATP-dependent zinc protease [Acidimicrobiaceae bacterium]